MTNRLSFEASPYLKQHAENPVDWHPWDDEALALAKSEAKPILLSIGYSTCHWCHVMAHESFEDPAIARVMNEHFINIKVDREERPDLDKIYQMALQLINPQGGGWPLTMFLDPTSHLPFFGGTYFPNQPRYQLPGFSDLLLRLADAFQNQKEELAEQGEKLQATLAQMVPPLLDPNLKDIELLQTARDQLGQQYDPRDGGFGGAPKFPMAHVISRLLRHWRYTRKSGGNDKEALDMVMVSLTQMARGGIFDHIGGGFCRYATDAKWMVPHFEKMLYDNALLLKLYAAALHFGPDELFQSAIRESITWLEREMRHPSGGFYAALDADAEGQEGKFYVWRREHVKKLLTEDEYLVVETLYGLDKPANFENQWNFHRHDSWRSVVERLSLEREEAGQLLTSAKGKLFNARSERIRPDTDTKILTAWNGLLISGLAAAGSQLKEPHWIELAQETADFLRKSCWVEGQLFATWQAGGPKHSGYLDDYANLLQGLLDLLSVAWREADIQFAVELADALIEKFYDSEEGGFFFTAHDHEKLILRPKPTVDDALPPGNGIAAIALVRLGHLLGESAYLDPAHNTLRWARGIMERVPAGHCALLNALEESIYPGEQIVLRGPIELMQQWADELAVGYTPERSCYLIPYNETTTLPGYLPRLVSSEQQALVTAYVCTGLTCSLPITALDEVKSLLKN
ncbi:MAG: thioredoxin domain-containing protein [Pseudomonadales bacterium]|nr:thioredoxin domain-containing protein [Pseudomonadales bacterium]